MLGYCIDCGCCYNVYASKCPDCEKTKQEQAEKPSTTEIKCECGSDSLGSSKHSHYCPKNEN